MEQLRRVVSSIKEPLPAKTRAIVISRAQMGMCKKAECIPVSGRSHSLSGCGVQTWVHQQLDQRFDLRIDHDDEAVMEGLAALLQLRPRR